MLSTPIAYRLMRAVELLIWTKMNCAGDEACWNRRAYNFTVSRKRSFHLDADFKVDLTIQIN